MGKCRTRKGMPQVYASGERGAAGGGREATERGKSEWRKE